MRKRQNLNVNNYPIRHSFSEPYNIIEFDNNLQYINNINIIYSDNNDNNDDNGVYFSVCLQHQRNI